MNIKQISRCFATSSCALDYPVGLACVHSNMCKAANSDRGKVLHKLLLGGRRL